MAIFDVQPSDIETFTVIATPQRTFSSSSLFGITGSVRVMGRRTATDRSITPVSAFLDSAHNDADVNAQLKTLHELGFVARQTSGSFYGPITAYMASVDAQSIAPGELGEVDIVRREQSGRFDSTLLKKLNAKDLLAPYHRPALPSVHWTYPNYHTINFFTASSMPSSNVLMYPNVEGGAAHPGYCTGSYSLSGAFSFDFHINPRYKPTGADFKAGTIFHLSSSYAVSLITGSARDENGKPSAFRLQLQLSHSADIAPSLAKPGNKPADLVFLSDDNSLKFNTWHHAIIRWGTNMVNDGTGSFNIDGVDRGTFVIPSGTVAPQLFTLSEGPSVLSIGNFCAGSNTGVDATAATFGPNTSVMFGVKQLWATDARVPFSYQHQLNAEVHDLVLHRRYLPNDWIAASGSVAIAEIDDTIAFCVPPFFRQASPLRRLVSVDGGIPYTPFATCNGSTEDPASALMSFCVNGHFINIENFIADLATGTQPLPFLMVFYTLASTPGDPTPATDTLYTDEGTRARNSFILPCDDGTFVPNFNLIGTCLTGSRHTDDSGNSDPSVINIDHLMSTASLLFGPVPEASTGSQETLMASLLGVTPTDPGAVTGFVLTSKFSQIDEAIASGTYTPNLHRDVPTFVFHATRDPSSNAIVLFDVSNIYYGSRILPGSITLTETMMSGTDGRVRISLKDDGFGGLYRSDCLTAPAIWNSVGSVFYDEGLLVLRSPHLALFGRDGYEISFKGERPIHAMKVTVLAPANMLNSSSNPACVHLPPSGFANDPDTDFVYVSGIDLMDENLNVLMRTQLAQPITKRLGDRIAFRLGIDM